MVFVLAGSALLLAIVQRARASDEADTSRRLSAVAQIGKAMFYDAALSGNGAMSCASCHSPANHYGPPNARSVQFGGPGRRLAGLRAVPTLTYTARTPAFTIGPVDPTIEAGETAPMTAAQHGGQSTGAQRAALLGATARPLPKRGNASANLVARGGLFWDGRATTLQEQALGPLFAHFEMNNRSVPALAATIRQHYGRALAQLFGQSVLRDDRMTVDEAAFAIARYQVEDPAFHPFSSKYDAYLAGKAGLSPAEARGLKLFDDPAKGNCAACHLDKPTPDGQPPLFTDFEFEALALPRNRAIPANTNPKFHDLGVCGPLRQDAAAKQAVNCGLFKTPTLRNVAARHVFFHNGVYHSLNDAVRFYALRDTQPARIYPSGPDGKVQAYDDLPKRYWGNIDRVDTPLDRHRGDPPALNDAQINDIVAFLRTLTDGWQKPPKN